MLASRLGYRITAKFVRTFFGRVFDHPARVFDEAFLRPETQDLEAFVDGIHNITEAQQRVARQYFEDGSIEDACPPLRALLSIMAEGTFEGKDAHHPDIRRLFTLDALLASDWYRERLAAKQRGDERLWRRHLGYLDALLAGQAPEPPAGGRAAPPPRPRPGRAGAHRVPAYLDAERHPRPRPQPPAAGLSPFVGVVFVVLVPNQKRKAWPAGPGSGLRGFRKGILEPRRGGSQSPRVQAWVPGVRERYSI